MNELESILNYLETTSLEPHDDYTSEFTYKEQKLLWNYIKQLKEQLEASEKARKEASNILKDYIPDEYIRSCDTSDGIGRYELDTESWQYKIYEILDIDKGDEK